MCFLCLITLFIKKKICLNHQLLWLVSSRKSVLVGTLVGKSKRLAVLYEVFRENKNQVRDNVNYYEKHFWL